MRDQILEALRALAARSAACGGPTDVVEFIAEPEDYPTMTADPDAQYWLGYLRGAADALDVTIIDLPGEYGVPA